MIKSDKDSLSNSDDLVNFQKCVNESFFLNIYWTGHNYISDNWSSPNKYIKERMRARAAVA